MTDRSARSVIYLTATKVLPADVAKMHAPPRPWKKRQTQQTALPCLPGSIELLRHRRFCIRKALASVNAETQRVELVIVAFSPAWCTIFSVHPLAPTMQRAPTLSPDYGSRGAPTTAMAANGIFTTFGVRLPRRSHLHQHQSSWRPARC